MFLFIFSFIKEKYLSTQWDEAIVVLSFRKSDLAKSFSAL